MFLIICLIFFFISSETIPGVKLFETQEGEEPKIVRFNDSFVVVSKDQNNILNFHQFNETGSLLLNSSYTGNQPTIIDFSNSNGFISKHTNKKAFYLIISYVNTLEILRVEHDFSTIVVNSIQEQNEEFLHPRIAYISGDNSFEYFGTVWEQKEQTGEGLYSLYANHFSFNNNDNSFTTEKIGADFFSQNSTTAFLPSIAVIGEEDMMIAHSSPNKNTIHASFLQDPFTAEPYKDEIIEDEENHDTFLHSLEVVGKGNYFACISSANKDDHSFGFSFNINENPYVLTVLPNEAFSAYDNPSIDIIDNNGNIITFYSLSNGDLRNRFFEIGTENKYEQIDVTTMDLITKKNPKTIVLSNKIVYVWDEIEDNRSINLIKGIIDDLNLFVPTKCETGQYLKDDKCIYCPNEHQTAINEATDENDCVCQIGYTLQNSSCIPCAQNTYKEDAGNMQCTPCPDNTVSNPGSTNEDECEDEEDPIINPTGNNTTTNNDPNVITTIALISGIFGLILVFLIIVFIVVIIIFIVLVKKTKKKANRFDHIEGIDMILKEAELEQKEKINKIPTFTVKKSKYIIDFKEIKLLKKLGNGGLSQKMIYLADWNGTKSVFKGFSEGTSIISGTETNASGFIEFEKEVEICVSLNHPNIVQFYGASITPRRIGLLLQYCENEDLESFLKEYKIKNNNKKYQKENKLRILKEIVNGMDYLHNRKLIHRDLKLENILLDSNEHSKISNFGLAKTINNISKLDKTMTKMIGSVLFMAPEVIEGNKYSYSCDIFSYAILAYITITEQFFPYGTKISNSAIMGKLIVDPNFRPEIKEQDFDGCEFLIPIIQKCWNFSPEKRFSFSELKSILEDKKINSVK